MFRKKWVEILVTDDRTAFFAAKNALEAKTSPTGRTSPTTISAFRMNTLGADPGRDGFVKTYYKILVEEKYAPAADILRTGACGGHFAHRRLRRALAHRRVTPPCHSVEEIDPFAASTAKGSCFAPALLLM